MPFRSGTEDEALWPHVHVCSCRITALKAYIWCRNMRCRRMMTMLMSRLRAAVMKQLRSRPVRKQGCG